MTSVKWRDDGQLDRMKEGTFGVYEVATITLTEIGDHVIGQTAPFGARSSGWS